METAKLNENGKIDLFLCRDMGSNMLKVNECDTIEQLQKTGRELLRQGANCANNLPAREYAYIASNGNMVFGWLNPEEDELLKKWIVINFGADCEDPIRVTRRENFEKMNACNVYDGRYGVKLSCDEAGCYVFSNRNSDIAEYFYNEFIEKFPHINDDQESIWGLVRENLEMSHNDFVEYLENNKSLFCEEFSVTLEQYAEMLKFFLNWKENNERHTEATGWTYHDSHNFQTVVLESECGDPQCWELDEDEQIEILLQMPQTTPHIEGTNTSEETEDYRFHFDRWATNPWYCYVEKK